MDVRRNSWAHPRSRGENAYLALPTVSAEGSSPLARGKHVYPRDIWPLLGLIPARAGKTISHGTHRILRRAHPRSRGENRGGSAFRLTALGSSPLARGKRYRADTIPLDKGLIPARAGKTYRRGAERSAARAHPRSRGENRGGDACGVVAVGSSPLARGNRKPTLPAARCRGLIPARAGKTRLCARRSSTAWAHPRSRGENGIVALTIKVEVGSSPLARGKLSFHPSK